MASPKTQLETIFDFLELTPQMTIANIVSNTSFQSLANMEDEKGFKEASEHSRFFRVGKKDQWSSLTSKQQNRIEQKFHKTMNRLGYL